MPIQNFRHKGLRRLYQNDDPSGVRPDWANKLRDMLLAIDTAEKVGDVAKFPGWKLHRLTGDLKGFWGITLTGNWRLIFRFENGDAFDLDIKDYH